MPTIPLQTVLAIMSDGVYLGRDSYFHVADRIGASFHFVFAILAVGLSHATWDEYMSIFCLLCFRSLSYYATVYRNQRLFEYAHTMWHLSTLPFLFYWQRRCEWAWSDACRRQWVGLVYCDCTQKGGSMVIALLLVVVVPIALTILDRISSVTNDRCRGKKNNDISSKDAFCDQATDDDAKCVAKRKWICDGFERRHRVQ